MPLASMTAFVIALISRCTSDCVRSLPPARQGDPQSTRALEGDGQAGEPTCGRARRSGTASTMSVWLRLSAGVPTVSGLRGGLLAHAPEVDEEPASALFSGGL